MKTPLKKTLLILPIAGLLGIASPGFAHDDAHEHQAEP